jgi:hypothetical protein
MRELAHEVVRESVYMFRVSGVEVRNVYALFRV